MRLENRNDILYLDKIKFKSVKDNKVDYTCEKMVEIETAEELEILLNSHLIVIGYNYLNYSFFQLHKKQNFLQLL